MERPTIGLGLARRAPGPRRIALQRPAHANTFWYTLGGITLIGILVLVATGIWLAQYCR